MLVKDYSIGYTVFSRTPPQGYRNLHKGIDISNISSNIVIFLFILCVVSHKLITLSIPTFRFHEI